MTASEKDWTLARRFWSRGINQIDRDHCRTLRRAELTLHRWHELECGLDNGYGSTIIVERDGLTNKPIVSIHTARGVVAQYNTPDRKTGAINRVKSLCDSLGLYFFVQTDPRGASLYVSDTPINYCNYTNGICCCI